jgi:hypothetical protein
VLRNLPQTYHLHKTTSRPLRKSFRRCAALEVERKKQSARILALFIRANGGWVPLPEIMALGIAQCNTRLHEYRLFNGMSELSKESKPSPATPAPRGSSDWYENSTGKKRPAVAPENLWLWERR